MKVKHPIYIPERADDGTWGISGEDGGFIYDHEFTEVQAKTIAWLYNSGQAETFEEVLKIVNEADVDFEKL